MTFLERPFHPTSLISLARAALRARRRQYEASDRIEAIRTTQERLSVALAAGGLGNWILEFDGARLIASADCKAHYGRAPADPFPYADLMNSIYPDDRERMKSAVRECGETGEDYAIEYRCVWPDGSVHWVAVNGRRETDASGNPVRMVGISRDITERRASEEALRAFAAELEERVEERTREHERVTAQLHEAQKLETLGQLTGGVAHDFNNLLTPIMGALDLIKRRMGQSEPRLIELTDNALQSAERARTLVQRLLGFARRTQLRPMPVDLGALIASMSDLIRSSVGSQIAVETVVADALPPALADPNQVELALLNLCVNARDAMPDGGTLTLSVETDSNTPAFLALRVADTGQGMDGETMRRAIEPFFSTKETGRGTGLGLSMVHGLAAQLGGSFELESKLGEGTRATLRLPVSEEQADAAQTSTPVPVTAAARALNVLLVDDEPLVRMGTAAMIRDLGHEVIEASGGNEVLAQLGNGDPPDILVTDYRMPGMDGPELIRRARAAHPALPILLVTGYGGEDAAVSGVKHLMKPFGQSEIACAIEAAMA